MRLAVLLVAVGSVFFVGIMGLSQQTKVAQSHIAANSSAAPALDTSRIVLSNGSHILGLALAMGLMIAMVAGALVMLQGASTR